MLPCVTLTLRRLCACALGLTVAIPSTGRAQSVIDLHREAVGQARAGGNLPWSPAQALTWQNFRGPPREGLFKAAETFSSVTYLIGCLGRETRFTVLATFSTTESWVRRDIRSDSVAGPQTLRHEQTHFDLTEVLARELRRTLHQAEGLCPNRLQRARELFDSLSTVSQALQARYDAETLHGTSLESQGEWSRAVRARLDSLGSFSGLPAVP